jgi:cytochrome c biogenesis protein CcmG, thiol:disulfide interchange protein DsbE
MKPILRFILILVLSGMATAEVIPDFTLPGIDGIPFRMGKEIGKKIFVIDFWASWCKPCKTLLKRLQEIKNQDNEVDIIAISIDDASAQAMAANYIQGKRFDFITLFDAEGLVAKMLNPSLQIPFTLIVNRRGEIIYSHAGYVSGIEKEIMAKIQACK